jgi:tetratricopeptide (TPR) repeat protein
MRSTAAAQVAEAVPQIWSDPEVSKLKSLILEIHRRSLWQVLTIYLAVSFGALQLIDVVTTRVGLPDWVAPFGTVLLLIGLPVVLATAFMQPRALPVRDAASQPRQHHRQPPKKMLTWRLAFLLGIAAFSLLGFTTVGYVSLRALGVGPMGSLRAKGVLTERASILVADFTSTAGDSALARAATEAFRIDLAQSSEVAVLAPLQLAEVLRRMGRQPDAPLDLPLAREVAARDGMAAIVAGEINPVGRGFLLTAHLLNARNSQRLASARETAPDTGAVITAIDRLSKRLRERIGESYRSLQREQPLDRVTTSSLDALRKFSLGTRAIDLSGDEARGILLLEEAIALDTGFAMAYRKLGATLSNRFLERARAVDALTRAYRHRDRLSTRERYLAEAAYLTQVTWQPDHAIAVYHNMLELDSTDSYALNNIGFVYSWMNEDARAVEYFLRATRVASPRSFAYSNAVDALVGAGKVSKAREILTEFRQRFPTNQRYFEFAGMLSETVGDYAAAERSFHILRDSAASSSLRTIANENLAHLEATQGRLARAEQYLSELVDEHDAQNLPGSSLTRVAELAALDVLVRRDAEGAFHRLEDALRRQPLAGLHPLERPYCMFAMVYASALRPDRARTLLAEYDAQVPPTLRNQVDRLFYGLARMHIALAEGRAPEVIASTQSAADKGRSPCGRCDMAYRGQAFELLGQPDSTVAYYERYVNTPWLRGTTYFDRWYLGGVLERLGELYDMRGDTQKASEYYNRFIELWENADLALQPRVGAARTRLQQIMARRG